MLVNERAKAMLEVLRHSLLLHNQQHTRQMLGDRASYLGLSDIAHFQDCPRAAVANKCFTDSNELKDILPLHRGHWFEAGIVESIKSTDLNFMHQLEIATLIDGRNIKAHLDITFIWDKPYPAVRVVEIKSVNQIPDMAYKAHETQLLEQVGMLKTLWNEQAFSLKNSSGQILYGNLSFTEICEKHCGIRLSSNPDAISIEGWLLYLSMNDAQSFGPYLPDISAYNELLQLAGDFWKQLENVHNEPQTLNNIPYVRGFHPLCAFCQVNADCPKFKDGDFQPQWEETLEKLDNLKERRSHMDTEIREIEKALKQAHRLGATENWINSGKHRFKVCDIQPRKSISRDLLREDLLDIFSSRGITDIDVDTFLASCEREGTPTSRLLIQAIK